MQFTRIVALFLAALSAGCFKAEVNADPNTLGGLIAGYRTGSFLAAREGVLFYGQDVLCYPRQEVELAARLQSPRDLDGVPGVTVAFYEGGKSLGRAVTDKDGFARLRWSFPAEGRYTIRIKPIALPEDIDENHRGAILIDAALLVQVARRDAKFVVLDLDHTLVDGGSWAVLSGDPPPLADSLDVVRRLAGDYLLIYLTQRPDLLTCKSKLWLESHEFPPGVLLAGSIGKLFDGNEEYKSKRLAEARKNFPNMVFGVGDKTTDAQAYLSNGMVVYLIPRYARKPREMRNKAQEVLKIPKSARLQVVHDWREIEAGIYGGARFPAASFAASLNAQADQIERKKK